MKKWSAGLLLAVFLPTGVQAQQDGRALVATFTAEVDRRLEVPAAEQAYYGGLAAKLLEDRNMPDAQYVVLVDRSKLVQALLIFWMSPERVFHFIGASPVSTGKPGRVDYFTTPLGVFPHLVSNMDFRAEGTRNEHGIRGYGRKGLRVFDFGWQNAHRGWGKGGESAIRLQMHATDADFLEKRIGSAQSKGCIRIPASLNVFLDQHGVLDGDYDAALKEGRGLWVLSKTRQPTPWAGRFLLIVDSERTTRPDWAPAPKP